MFVLLFSFCHFFDDGLAIAACVPPKREKGLRLTPQPPTATEKKRVWPVDSVCRVALGVVVSRGRCFKTSHFTYQDTILPRVELNR